MLKEGCFSTRLQTWKKVKAQQITHQVVIKNVDEEVTQEDMEETLDRQEFPYKSIRRIRSRQRNAPTKMFCLILKDEGMKKKLLREGLFLDQMHFTCVTAPEDSSNATKIQGELQMRELLRKPCSMVSGVP